MFLCNEGHLKIKSMPLFTKPNVSFRFLPGDPFKFKALKNNTAFMMNHFDQRINERTPAPSGDQYKDFVDAYLAKIEKEKDEEGTTFTRKYIYVVMYHGYVYIIRP